MVETVSVNKFPPFHKFGFRKAHILRAEYTPETDGTKPNKLTEKGLNLLG